MRWTVLAAMTVGMIGCGGGPKEGTTPPSEPPPETPAPPSTSKGTVDIVLAAGTPGNGGSCHFSGLSSDPASCELYKVTYDKATRKLTSHTKVVGDGIAGWMPSVSPDGTRLAYGSPTGKQCTTHVKDLNSTNPSDPGTAVMCSGMELPLIWAFPSWVDNDTLLVSHPNMAPQCVKDGKCQQLDRWNTVFEVKMDGNRAVSAKETLGVGATARMSVQDTWVNPVKPHLVAGHGQIATRDAAPVCSGSSGLSCADIYQSPMPFVIDTKTGKYWIYQLRTTESRYAKGQPLNLVGCAHLAWTPDGNSLLCTEQGTMEMKDHTENSRLFMWSVDTSRDTAGEINQRDVEPMFSHKQPGDLVSIGPDQGCGVFYHKYAEFCGDSDHVVASVVCDCDTPACQKGGSPTQVLQSHVYMIDRSKPTKPAYVDLTAQLEERLGKPYNSMRSFTATCVPGSGDGSAARGKAPAGGAERGKGDAGKAERGGGGAGKAERGGGDAGKGAKGGGGKAGKGKR